MTHHFNGVFLLRGDITIKRITKEQILNRCNDFGVTYIDNYVGDVYGTLNTRIKFECPKHLEKGIIDLDWGHFNSSSRGCPYCAGKHKTKEDFQKEIPDNILLLEDYKGLYTKIRCRCRVCGFEWEARPDSLKRGCYCPSCLKANGNKKRKTDEVFKDDLYKVNPNIVVLSEYKGAHDKIHCKCLIHNLEWDGYPSNLLNGSATCPMCGMEMRTEKLYLTNSEFKDRLYSIRNDVEPLEPYKGARSKIKCRCVKHNNYFEMDPIHLFRYQTNCTECQKDNMSLGERLILEYLEENKINYTYQKIFDDCRNIMPLRFDFYLNDCNMCIEYDGEQHYKVISIFNATESDLRDNQLRDRIKDQYCINNNIKLLRVPYWERDNIKTILQENISYS